MRWQQARFTIAINRAETRGETFLSAFSQHERRGKAEAHEMNCRADEPTWRHLTLKNALGDLKIAWNVSRRRHCITNTVSISARIGPTSAQFLKDFFIYNSIRLRNQWARVKWYCDCSSASRSIILSPKEILKIMRRDDWALTLSARQCMRTSKRHWMVFEVDCSIAR